MKINKVKLTKKSVKSLMNKIKEANTPTDTYKSILNSLDKYLEVELAIDHDCHEEDQYQCGICDAYTDVRQKIRELKKSFGI